MSKNAVYRNSSFKQPVDVSVLIFQDRLNIYEAEGMNLIGIAHLADCHTTLIQDNFFVYLDKHATAYLVVKKSSPLHQELEGKFKRKPKRSKAIKATAVVLLLLAFVIGGYLAIVQAVPYLGLKVISKEQEISMGRQFYQNFMSGTDVNINQTHLVQQFSDEITLSNQYPIKVTVVNDTTVNAFALPGGNIVVYTGLLESIRSSSEFAALLGHEASHINQRHSLRSILRSVASSIVLSLVFGDGGAVSSFILQNADMLRELSYSRALEEEADEEGMKILLKNKINPEGMKTLMETLEVVSEDEGEGFAFLSTHPVTKSRIRHAEDFIKANENRTFQHQPILDSLWNKISRPGDL